MPASVEIRDLTRDGNTVQFTARVRFSGLPEIVTAAEISRWLAKGVRPGDRYAVAVDGELVGVWPTQQDADDYAAQCRLAGQPAAVFRLPFGKIVVGG